MMRRATKNLLLDRIHKGAVIVCMGVTLFGALTLGAKVYSYYTDVRPELKNKELLLKQELLREGAADKSLLSEKNITYE